MGFFRTYRERLKNQIFGPGGASDFLAGARDIAKGKDRSEDEKSEVKPTRQIPENKKPSSGCPNEGGDENLAATYSPILLSIVPSATRGLTAEFGMGSGVSLSLWPPEKMALLFAT